MISNPLSDGEGFDRVRTALGQQDAGYVQQPGAALDEPGQHQLTPGPQVASVRVGPGRLLARLV
ncbi:MAG TPA: hypothetical protein VGD69_21035 [Herpetosiphonaceae bacterium]